MPDYRVTVTEILHETYDPITVTAKDRDEARRLAEEDRVNGALGTPNQAVVDVHFDIVHGLGEEAENNLTLGLTADGRFGFYGTPEESAACVRVWGRGPDYNYQSLTADGLLIEPRDHRV